MKDPIKWSLEEFKAYLLLHAAKADQKIADEEIYILQNKFPAELLHNISQEINRDNDNQRIEKLLKYINHRNFTKDQKEALLNDMKEIFLADGEFETIEYAVYRFLKKIFDHVSS